MSGQRRANWESKLDAAIDAHRDDVARQLDDEATIRSQHVGVLTDRIELLRGQLWRVKSGLIFCGITVTLLAIWAVTR
jgi:hypothetical protein